MTHVKNAEAFARLIAFCTGYGGIYNPGSPNLQIDALVDQLAETDLVLENVKIAKTEFDNQTNMRKQTFNQLPHLMASIMRTLEASGAKTEKLNDARAFIHQIVGSSWKNRKTIPSETAENVKAHRSHLQLAYVSKVDSFSKLVKSVSSEPLYQPREKQLSRSGLEEKITELNLLNQKVEEARTKWKNYIIERNRVLYQEGASLTGSARAAKKYVRAIYGLNSAQYGLIKDLNFPKPNP